jgi:hypothetical protein
MRPQSAVELIGGQLPAGGGKGISHQQPLTRHPLAGSRKSLSGCEGCSIHAATLAQPRLRIM